MVREAKVRQVEGSPEGVEVVAPPRRGRGRPAGAGAANSYRPAPLHEDGPFKGIRLDASLPLCKLVRAIDARGFAYKPLAVDLGFHPNKVSEMKNRSGRPLADEVLRFCRAINVSFTYIADDDVVYQEDPPPFELSAGHSLDVLARQADLDPAWVATDGFYLLRLVRRLSFDRGDAAAVLNREFVLRHAGGPRDLSEIDPDERFILEYVRGLGKGRAWVEDVLARAAIEDGAAPARKAERRTAKARHATEAKA